MSKKGEFWNTCRGTIKGKDRIPFSREKLALHIKGYQRLLSPMQTFLTDTSVYVPVTYFTCTANTYLYMYLVSEIYYYFVTFIYKIKVEISTCNVKKYMYCQFQVLHTKVGDVPLLGSACHAFV